MTPEHVTGDSLTHWLDGVKAGDSIASQEMWNRYFTRLVAIAEAQLRNISAECSGEDIALSVLKSVMLGLQKNRYPDVAGGSSLWPLLVTITARKSISEFRRQLALKRATNLNEHVPDLQTFVGHEPSPEFAAQVADELNRVVLMFDDPKLRTIAERKLEGFTTEEIAKELGCTARTVIRKLNRIRQEWTENSLSENN